MQPHKISIQSKNPTIEQIVKLENRVKQGFKKVIKTIAVFLDISGAYGPVLDGGSTGETFPGQALLEDPSYTCKAFWRKEQHPLEEVMKNHMYIYIQENAISQAPPYFK